MTKMASYEENEARRNVMIGSYFRGDYLGLQVIKSIISATIAFCMVFAAYILYHFEELIADIYKMDLFEFGKSVIVDYLIFTAVYAVISYGVYMYKYASAKKSLKKYYNNLKKLSYLYEKENKK